MYPVKETLSHRTTSKNAVLFFNYKFCPRVLQTIVQSWLGESLNSSIVMAQSAGLATRGVF